MKYDFSGWATKNNLKCSDGRTIMRDAFKGNDGQTVPLVWNHQHNDPLNVLGHAVLENREKLTLTGILDIYSFDDQIIIIETELGLLTIKGDNLKISKLSLDTSDFVVDGKISSLAYSDSVVGTKKGKGILGKIFK